MSETIQPQSAVLVTSDKAKLPPEIAALVEPAVPIPPGVTFFERRVTAGSVASAAAWAIGLGFFALILIPFGIAEVIHPSGPVTVTSHVDYWPLGIGVTCALAAWVMGSNIGVRYRLRADQVAGRPTRVGILLTPAVLVEAAESTYTVLPRSQYRGIAARRVRYEANGQEKLIYLPAEIIGVAPAEVDAAIAAWATNGVTAD